MIKGQAPGTILQFIFIRNRIGSILGNKNHFVEVGSGKGYLSNLLLSRGNTGIGVDLNISACEYNSHLNRFFIEKNEYKVLKKDFIDLENFNFDFLISSMVIEHITEDQLNIFFKHAKKIIKPNGKLIFLVPSNMDAWGIEDEIAGHVKRYNFKDIDKLAEANELKVDFKCGLNYPISNWLLKLSNKIVSKNESHLKAKSDTDKTIYTGNRMVKFKTIFPSYLNIILNEMVMYPFHILQKINRKNEKSLVMYFELSLK